jgi:hypothetical protein
MEYRKGDVLLVRVVATYDHDGLKSDIMAHPPGEEWNSRAVKLANIVGVERLKFEPGETAVYDNEPCVVRFVDAETNKAWISSKALAVDDLVVPVSTLTRPAPGEKEPNTPSAVYEEVF